MKPDQNVIYISSTARKAASAAREAAGAASPELKKEMERAAATLDLLATKADTRGVESIDISTEMGAVTSSINAAVGRCSDSISTP